MTEGLPVTPAPHMRPRTSVPVVMRTVLYALIPGLLAYVWSFGTGLLVNISIAAAAAIATEALCLKLRRQRVDSALTDFSAVVTAVLLALTLPPLLPWWVPALAAIVAIGLGKQIYGGIGNNLFNPAMVGYVVVLLSFPAEMTQWLAPLGSMSSAVELGLWDHIVYAVTSRLPGDATIDAVTQATPLDVAKLGLAGMRTVQEIRVGPLFGSLAGSGWELISASIAAGGLYLLWRGAIRWQIPCAVIAGLTVPATVLYLVDPSRFLPPTFHLLSGAALLGAFFIATDPVTAAATDRGRLYFGAGIGALTYVIRTWGGYPDGVAFAVLLMNACVPVIDRFTRPRIYGHD